MVVGFFYFETKIPSERAAVYVDACVFRPSVTSLHTDDAFFPLFSPPATWFLPNFAVLFGTALLPYFWWTTIFTVYTTLWQDIYGWSAISTAEHMIPIGVLAFAMSFTGSLSRVINSKWIILFAESILIVATILLAFADSPGRYWSFVFPAFVLGSAGAMLTYTHTKYVFTSYMKASYEH